MKKKLKHHIFPVVFSIICIFFAAYSMASASDDIDLDLNDAKTALNNYITETYPEIKIGSGEYNEFLSSQLVYDTDLKLKQMKHYDGMMAYASLYISDCGVESNLVEDNEALGNQSIWSVYKAYAENEKQKEEMSVSEESGDKASTDAKGYSGSKAASYAIKYALSYNTPAYPSYGGSDCTNFVSQCVKAGGKAFNYAPSYKQKAAKYDATKYWYSYHYTATSPYHQYKQSTSFMRVSDFYVYWKSKGATIINCSNKSALQKNAKIGDIVQLAKKNSSGNLVFYHSIIITDGSKNAWKYSGHTNDKKNASVSGIADTNTFRIIRIS